MNFYRLPLTFSPAAADTLIRYFNAGGKLPDMILTGDLGYEGATILREMMDVCGYDISGVHTDCGLMIFDREGQDKHAGGSGCGCSASVLGSVILNNMKAGKLCDVVFIGTGALMNPMSIQQGQNIAGIGHLVRIQAGV